jgi:putative transposase
MMDQRRTTHASVKLEVVRMIKERGLSVRHVSQSVDIGQTAISRWMVQHEAEVTGKPSIGNPRSYLRLERGFAYLVAVIVCYSRRVLSWRISNSMDAVFCVNCLEDALREHGKSEVINAVNSPAKSLQTFLSVRKSPSAWRVVAEPMKISLWNGFGGASDTKTCATTATPRWANC